MASEVEKINDDDFSILNYVLIGICVILFVGIVYLFLSGTGTNTVIETKYVCSDNSTVNESANCPPIKIPESEKRKTNSDIVRKLAGDELLTYDTFEIELDYRGATGYEDNGYGQGFGDRVIDDKDCWGSNQTKDRGYIECDIRNVEIWFSTLDDRNPLGANNSGKIYGNDAIFRAVCLCTRVLEKNY